MNSLEGYNTNGHEYRASQIARNNSRRIKWLFNEAKKEVEKKDKESNDKNNTSKLHQNKTVEQKVIRNNVFNPKDINKFNNIKNKF